VVGLINGSDRRWGVSGVGSESIRSVVHRKALTEDGRGKGRMTYHYTVRDGRSKSQSKKLYAEALRGGGKRVGDGT